MDLGIIICDGQFTITHLIILSQREIENSKHKTVYHVEHFGCCCVYFRRRQCVLHGTRSDEVFLHVGTKGLCVLVRRQIYKVTSCSEAAARGRKEKKKKIQVRKCMHRIIILALSFAFITVILKRKSVSNINWSITFIHNILRSDKYLASYAQDVRTYACRHSRRTLLSLSDINRELVGKWGRYNDGLRAGRPGLDSRLGQDIFLYSTASRLALRPTQHPIQRVEGVLPDGVKRQGREADHSPPSRAEVKNGGPIPPLPRTSSRRSV
jgi:hypothetical protein